MSLELGRRARRPTGGAAVMNHGNSNKRIARSAPSRARPDAPVNRPTSAGIAITAERAHELSERLGVPVTIDESGWLCHGVALRYQRGPHVTIQPRALLVGASCLVQDVLANARIVTLSHDYNNALQGLHGLTARLLPVISGLPRDSEACVLHQELSKLDDMVAGRQATRMGNGLVSPAILESEVAYLMSYYEQALRIVRAAEQVAGI
jgi:hypothetical protein